MFDHTLDNMSLMEDQMPISELLREKGMTHQRSRFISDESITGFHFSDIPDKSFDNEVEEYKEPPSTFEKSRRFSFSHAPVELLGIPMQDSFDDDKEVEEKQPHDFSFAWF